MNLARVWSFATALCLLSVLTGCGEVEEDAKAGLQMPTFQDEQLMAGRRVWQHTCRACHLLGVGGAPPVTEYAQWKVRLHKGKEALYQSALNGVRGDDGKFRMPPRGGNTRLSDKQIRLAVDYKLAAVDALRRDTR
jgi:cytochrome c5